MSKSLQDFFANHFRERWSVVRIPDLGFKNPYFQSTDNGKASSFLFSQLSYRAMSDVLFVSQAVQIPKSEFQINYVRSPGPGGQHVNKVSTKAVVHWSVYQSPSLPDPVKHRLMLAQKNRVNNDGQLVVSSHEFRSQIKNLEACLEKIRRMIENALHPPKRRKVTQIPKAAKRKRLAGKRELSEKKQRRTDRSWKNE